MLLGVVMGIRGYLSVESVIASVVGKSDIALAVGFLFLIAGGVIGYFIGQQIASARSPQGIQPLSTWTDYPRVQAMEKQGWRIGSKPLGVQ